MLSDRSTRKLLFTEAELRELYEQQQLSTRAIARVRGCSASGVKFALARHGIARRPPRRDPVYPRRPFSGNPVEKAYLLGFRDGDLHVQKANRHETSRTIIVACASTRQEQIDLIRELFEPYGRVHLGSTPRQMVAACYLDVSFEFLLRKSEWLPSWVLDNDQCFAAYLAGYVDAEASIAVKRATRASELVLRSGDYGLRACELNLRRLGIDCPRLRLLKTAGQRDGAHGPVYHRNHWCLAVYKQSAVHRLFELIGPYMRHAKRRHDMQLAWQNIRDRASFKSL